MIRSILVLVALVSVSSMAAEDFSDIQPVKIDISKKIPVPMDDVTQLRTYASTNNYYFSVNLKEGMRVLYSTSYGINGEAGQAAGVIVKKGDKFYFKQKKNPTGQLLLPPGMPFNGNVEHSLWDIGAYMDLVNRVVFSEPNTASKTSSDVYGKPEAALVDFKGGTAGSSVTYTDALEVGFTRSVSKASKSDWKVYYAKGIGPVALEFRETMSPSGTFKFYVGE